MAPPSWMQTLCTMFGTATLRTTTFNRLISTFSQNSPHGYALIEHSYTNPRTPSFAADILNLSIVLSQLNDLLDMRVMCPMFPIPGGDFPSAATAALSVDSDGEIQGTPYCIHYL